MLSPETIFVWSQNPFSPASPKLAPMIYTCPNADGSFSGYNTRTAAAQLQATPGGKRVLIFQSMLSGLFDAPGDIPPFYFNGAAACAKNVAIFFQALRAAGVQELDAVIPDAEGALEDWQITPAVAATILASPQAANFLQAIGYPDAADAARVASGAELSAFIQSHRQQVRPILSRYADAAIYRAIQPLRDLYGDVLIQKGSLAVPSFAASIAPQPWDAGDSPGIAFQSSFVQCAEFYGARQAGYPQTAQQIADIWLTQAAAAMATNPKPVMPWIAPKSYAGSPAFPIPWCGTDVYDSFVASLLKLTRGNALYWRPGSATAADDEAILKALD